MRTGARTVFHACLLDTRDKLENTLHLILDNAVKFLAGVLRGRRTEGRVWSLRTAPSPPRFNPAFRVTH